MNEKSKNWEWMGHFAAAAVGRPAQTQTGVYTGESTPGGSHTGTPAGSHGGRRFSHVLREHLWEEQGEGGAGGGQGGRAIQSSEAVAYMRPVLPGGTLPTQPVLPRTAQPALHRKQGLLLFNARIPLPNPSSFILLTLRCSANSGSSFW